MVAAASTITDEREQVVDFSVPYYNALQSLTVNTQETPDITSTDQLGQGDVVGVQKGTTGKIWAEENLVPQGVELEDLHDVARTRSATSRRGTWSGSSTTRRHRSRSSRTCRRSSVVQDIETNEHYGLAFSPSNPDLREAVNFVFAQMVADGTYATIYGKYFPPDSLPPEFAPTFLTNRSIEGPARTRAGPCIHGGDAWSYGKLLRSSPRSPRTSEDRRPRCRRRSSRWASPRWW